MRALHRSRTRAHHHDQLPPDDTEPTRIPWPRGLDAAERRYWQEFEPLLSAARVLTAADVQTLRDYCACCVAVDERNRRLRVELRRKKIDRALVNMLDRQLRGWIERKTKVAGELGLTAIARVRLGWTGHYQPGSKGPQVPDRPPSKLEQLQQRAAALRRPMGMK